MSTQAISKATEQKFINHVKQAIHLANDGMSPNEAIAKVARDASYNHDFINRFVEVFNTSKTLSHFDKKAQDRGVDFDLADAPTIIEKVYGSKPVKEASVRPTKHINLMGLVHVDEDLIKSAAERKDRAFLDILYGAGPTAYARDPEEDIRRIYSERRRTKQAMDSASVNLTSSRDKQEDMFAKLAQYFRTPGSDPFEEVERKVAGSLGELGARVMDVAWHLLGNQPWQKRAADLSIPIYTDFKSGPYKLIDGIVKQVKQTKQAETRYKEAKDKYEKVLGDIVVMERRLRDKCSDPTIVKAAADKASNEELSDSLLKLGAGGMLAALGMAATSMGPPEKPKIPVYMPAEDIDPDFVTEMKAIKTESILQDLINNDPVISKYDPEEVYNKYNQLSQLAPNAINKEVIMRGYLRRMLESGDTLEPFEAKQLTETEKDVSQSDPERLAMTAKPAIKPTNP